MIKWILILVNRIYNNFDNYYKDMFYIYNQDNKVKNINKSKYMFG